MAAPGVRSKCPRMETKLSLHTRTSDVKSFGAALRSPASGSANRHWLSVVQEFTQSAAGSVQARHDSPHRNPRDGGYFRVGVTFHVGQVDRCPEIFAELLQRLFDGRVRQPFQGFGLGGFQSRWGNCLRLGQLPVLDLCGASPAQLTLAFPAGGDEGIDEDPPQPGVQVRALLELMKTAVCPGERL